MVESLAGKNENEKKNSHDYDFNNLNVILQHVSVF